jgi:hypothetical protein
MVHPLLDQYRYTLLGRLRMKVFSQITGSTDRLPSQKEVWSFLMPQWKRNPLAASLYFQILHLQGSRRVSFPTSLSSLVFRANLADIVLREPIWALFAEDDSGDEPIGCIAIGHTRPNGEPGYYAAIYTERGFPDAGFISLAPIRKVDDSHIAELGSEGWIELSISEAAQKQDPCIAITAIHEYLPGTVRMPLERIKHLESGDEPPTDPELMRRLELVMTGKLVLAKGTVSRDLVRLFDEDFGKRLDPRKIAQLVDRVDDGLLVYWNGEYFVCSDDYYGYLGYQLLKRDRVNVVIMGDFPLGSVTVELLGDEKLLPPVLIGRETVTPGDSSELHEWRAREQHARERRLATPSDLLARWVGFADLLGESNPSERSLHVYLLACPIMLGANWDKVESEVWFGPSYRADFVLRANRALPTVRLVELERANHRLFTKDLHETDEVTHAVQQVSDWLRYCRQNPDDPVIAASRGVSPDGMVIIGRSRNLNEKEREVLAHNNQGRDVKVITYDELLDDFGTLILHRLDDGTEV